MTQPPPAGWSWVNQGSATVVSTYGGLLLTAEKTTGSPNMHLYTRSAPSTPYTITVACITMVFQGSYPHAGVGFRESSSGKLMTVMTEGHVNGIRVGKWNDYANWNSALGDELIVDTQAWAPCTWFRLENDGTTLKFYVGLTPYAFFLVASESAGTYITPDQVFFYADSRNTTHAVSIHILSWEAA